MKFHFEEQFANEIQVSTASKYFHKLITIVVMESFANIQYYQYLALYFDQGARAIIAQ